LGNGSVDLASREAATEVLAWSISVAASRLIRLVVRGSQGSQSLALGLTLAAASQFVGRFGSVIEKPN
jgi:hypothetical protein